MPDSPPKAENRLAEEEYASLLDRCFSDAVIKTSSGFVVGCLTSVLFLRRRTFPIWLGTGFGMGFAYGSCEKAIHTMAEVSELKVPYDL